MLKKRTLFLIILITFGVSTVFFWVWRKGEGDSKDAEKYFVCPDGSHHTLGIPSEGIEKWCEGKGYVSEQEHANFQQGTVTYVDLEGGFYGIITDDGKKLDPTNLPETFKEDGLKVRFRSEEKEGGFGIRMWGTIVELKEVEKLD